MIKVGDIRFAVFVTGATPYEDKDTAAILKATPRNDRLTALRAACLHIFRHLAQILLEIRRYSCVGFIQADEKSDGAIHTQSLCSVALKKCGNKISPPMNLARYLILICSPDCVMKKCLL